MLNKLFPDLRASQVCDLSLYPHEYARAKKHLVEEKLGSHASRLLKKDIVASHCLVELSDTVLIEIQIDSGQQNYSANKKIEQIYYFYNGDTLSTLGELFWVQYHWFYEPVRKFIKSLDITNLHQNREALFVGGRDNFTHALLDYAPTMLLAQDLDMIGNLPVYLGLSSSVQDLVLDSLGYSQAEWRSCQFDSYDYTITSGFRIRATRFKRLYAFRHGSIFRAVELLRRRLNEIYCRSDYDQSVRSSSKIALIRAKADRVANNESFIQLVEGLGYLPMRGFHRFSVGQRISLLDQCKRIIVPPGSDNVNAILFTREDCLITQMMPMPNFQSLYELRLFYYSSLRYLLPVTERLDFWIADRRVDALTGYWDHYKIKPDLTTILP